MSVITITGENYEQEVLKSDIPVLLDFWAEWCGPCLMLAPVIDEIANETDSVKVGKVNVDENAELAETYGIVSIPSLVFIKDGKTVSKEIGVKPKEVIIEMIKSRDGS